MMHAPRLATVTTSPCCWSRPIASRMGLRLTPRRAARSASTSLVPGANRPERISRRMARKASSRKVVACKGWADCLLVYNLVGYATTPSRGCQPVRDRGQRCPRHSVAADSHLTKGHQGCSPCSCFGGANRSGVDGVEAVDKLAVVWLSIGLVCLPVLLVLALWLAVVVALSGR